MEAGSNIGANKRGSAGSLASAQDSLTKALANLSDNSTTQITRPSTIASGTQNVDLDKIQSEKQPQTKTDFIKNSFVHGLQDIEGSFLKGAGSVGAAMDVADRNNFSLPGSAGIISALPGVKKGLLNIGRMGQETKDTAESQYEADKSNQSGLTKLAGMAAYNAPAIAPLALGGIEALGARGLMGLTGFGAKVGAGIGAGAGADKLIEPVLPEIKRDPNTGRIIDTDSNISNMLLHDAGKFIAEGAAGSAGYEGAQRLGAKIFGKTNLGTTREHVDLANEIAATAPDLSHPEQTLRVMSNLGKKIGVDTSPEQMINDPVSSSTSFYKALVDTAGDPEKMKSVQNNLRDLIPSNRKLYETLSKYTDQIQNNDAVAAEASLNEAMQHYNQAMDDFSLSAGLDKGQKQYQELKYDGDKTNPELINSAETLNKYLNKNTDEYMPAAVASQMFTPVQRTKNMLGDVFENLSKQAYLDKDATGGTSVTLSGKNPTITQPAIEAFQNHAPEMIKNLTDLLDTVKTSPLPGAVGSKAPREGDINAALDSAMLWVAKDARGFDPQAKTRSLATLEQLKADPRYDRSGIYKETIDKLDTAMKNPDAQPLTAHFGKHTFKMDDPKQVLPNLETAVNQVYGGLKHAYTAVADETNPNKLSYRLDEIGQHKQALDGIRKDMQAQMSGASEDELGALRNFYSKVRGHEDLLYNMGIEKPHISNRDYRVSNTKGMTKLVSERANIEQLINNLNEIKGASEDFVAKRGTLGNDITNQQLTRHVHGQDPYRRDSIAPEGASFNGNIDQASASNVETLMNNTINGIGAVLGKHLAGKKIDMVQDPKSAKLVEELLKTQGELTPLHRAIAGDAQLKTALLKTDAEGNRVAPKSIGEIRDSFISNPSLYTSASKIADPSVKSVLSDVENYHIKDVTKKALDLAASGKSPVDIKGEMSKVMQQTDNVMSYAATPKAKLLAEEMKGFISSLDDPDVFSTYKEKGLLNKVYETRNQLNEAENQIKNLPKSQMDDAKVRLEMGNAYEKAIDDYNKAKLASAKHTQQIIQQHLQMNPRIADQRSLAEKVGQGIMAAITPRSGVSGALVDAYTSLRGPQINKQVSRISAQSKNAQDFASKVEALANNEKMRLEEMQKIHDNEMKLKDNLWRKRLMRATILGNIIDGIRD